MQKKYVNKKMQPKMINILALLSSMSLSDFEELKQLSKIIKGIYSISTGGVTQKNISRQTEEDGYGYRSVQRFFKKEINWELLYLSCISYFFNTDEEKVYLLAIDEVVEAKAGKSTHRIGRFFSSIAGRPIASVCFHVLSLIEVNSRKSFITKKEQRIQATSKKAKNSKDSSKQKKKNLKEGKGKGKGKGRPKGSKDKNKTRADTGLSLSFERLLIGGLSLLSSIGIVPNYIVADGAYSSKTFLLICIEQKISLISKLRCTSALYLPAKPKQGKRGRGRAKKYGNRIYLDKLNRKSPYFYKTIEGKATSNLMIDVYRLSEIWTKFLPVMVNVTVLIVTNTRTNKVSRRILFSTDLALSTDLMIEYYSLRFQIEFNFRDAKQYFGLADFRAYKPIQVKNSVGLAFFMVNFSHIMRKKVTALWEIENLSILDVKAGFRVEKQVERILKHLDLDHNLFKNQVDLKGLAAFEAINLN
jgi:putative transposase